jgi:hypothetical protein
MFRAISETKKEMKSMDVLIVEPEKAPRIVPHEVALDGG